MDNWRSILSAVPQRPDDGVLEGRFVGQLRFCDQMRTDIAMYDRAAVGDTLRTYAGMYNSVLRILKRKSEDKYRSVEKSRVGGGNDHYSAAVQGKGKNKGEGKGKGKNAKGKGKGKDRERSQSEFPRVLAAGDCPTGVCRYVWHAQKCPHGKECYYRHCT